MSNVLTFRGSLPPSNVRPLNFSFDHRPAPAGSARPNRRRPNMHNFLFRSYDLIVASSEADLMRDVRCDVSKALSKLKAIQQQRQRDREHAAAREELLTRAEAKLAAAIAAVQSSRSTEG
ncbi:hypothetical protein IVB41_24570 [Bradyrhizobium sp. 44]|jgi:hypothetical protein|uniref:hypothetical protein n=1 Tax=Bradyrhizobium sp. 44 TaxID=2782675 RepID=UPI001FF96059|nr:hypothetical protein [Bradyrhizobium sp. 44]MCK1287087.1 hypothetical protein [Bradyrhizobium sp. 44]